MQPDLASHLQPGDRIVAGQGLGEPVALLSRLFEQIGDIPGLRYFGGMSMTKVLDTAPASLALRSFVAMGSNGPLIASGRMQLVPAQMSDLPGLFQFDEYRPDVVCVLVSPPDPDGFCSLGVESDYLWPALDQAQVVLAEINPRVPFVMGDTLIRRERIDGVVESERALPVYSREAPSAVEAAIAERVVALIEDGACLQIGIGRFADAVMEALCDRRDLGVHSGMVGDVLLDLVNAGIVTNRRKGIDEGLTVAGAILGSERCLEMAAKEPNLVLRSIDHTHSPAVLTALDNLVSVNSAIEVDLFGQVNAETASGRPVGAVGGSVDFMRAARLAPDGRSIVALPATSGKGAVSRIVPAVETVTALRSDVETVVTEFGTAHLRGLPLEDRVPLMIELAAPEHRDALRTAARAIGC